MGVSSFDSVLDLKFIIALFFLENKRNLFHIVLICAFFLRASFLTKTLHVEDHSFKFQIWDTAGQEKVSEIKGRRYFLSLLEQKYPSG